MEATVPSIGGPGDAGSGIHVLHADLLDRHQGLAQRVVELEDKLNKCLSKTAAAAEQVHHPQVYGGANPTIDTAIAGPPAEDKETKEYNPSSPNPEM